MSVKNSRARFDDDAGQVKQVMHVAHYGIDLLHSINPPLHRSPRIKKLRSGKVREVFDLGETLLFVATDRLSAFD